MTVDFPKERQRICMVKLDSDFSGINGSITFNRPPSANESVEFFAFYIQMSKGQSLSFFEKTSNPM